MKRSPAEVANDLIAWRGASGLANSDIALETGVNLSTVYRIFDASAPHKRVGSAVKKICKFAKIDLVQAQATDVPDVLRNAVMETWDGSACHADGLAKAIRAIGPLVCSANRV